VVVLETMATISLVRQGIKTVKNLCEASSDISEIASHVDQLLGHRDQLKNKPALKKKTAWQTFFSKTLKDDGDDPLSVTNFAAHKLEELAAEEQLVKLGRLVNHRYGADVWENILNARDVALEKAKIAAAKKKVAARFEPEKKNEFVDRIFKIVIEFLKFGAIVICAGGGGYLIYINRCVGSAC
jgi:outer membrane murein-binding lipoprotein Lpp